MESRTCDECGGTHPKDKTLYCAHKSQWLCHDCWGEYRRHIAVERLAWANMIIAQAESKIHKPREPSIP